MSAKRKKVFIAPPSGPRPILSFEIALIYFLTLTSLIFLTEGFSIPVHHAPGNLAATGWLKLQIFYYYCMPFILAVILGVAFPPFLKQFRNLLMIIFVVQLLYSAGVYFWRHDYLKRREEILYRSRIARVDVQKIRHQYMDENKDGRVEKILFTTEIDTGDYPGGQYEIYAVLSQKGAILPNREISRHRFVVLPGKKKLLRGRFDVEANKFRDYFKVGVIELNIGLKRILQLDKNTQRWLKVSRWAPFFRVTRWDGWDPDIRPEAIDLEFLNRVDTFYIIPADLQ